MLSYSPSETSEDMWNVIDKVQEEKVQLERDFEEVAKRLAVEQTKNAALTQRCEALEQKV